MASLRIEWQVNGRRPMKGRLLAARRLVPLRGAVTACRGFGMALMMSHDGLSRLSGALGVCAFVAVVLPAQADPRAVVELFTSQGCSSCPAADEILGDLSKDPSIVALSLPIDYWDYLGWKDTLADNRFTARQKAYSQMRGDRDVYTPQVIVNGSAHVIGNDRAAIDGAVRDTRKNDDVMSVPVSMSVSGRQLNVSVASPTQITPPITAKSGSVRSRRRCRLRLGAARMSAAK